MTEHPKHGIGRPFEHRRQPLASRRKFLRRQFRYLGYSLFIISVSIGIGVTGYCYYGELGLVDGFYNACMILTGMGPANPMRTDAAKIFSSIYALFSGLAFLTTAAVLFAPGIHRILHILNIDLDEEE